MTSSFSNAINDLMRNTIENFILRQGFSGEMMFDGFLTKLRPVLFLYLLCRLSTRVGRNSRENDSRLLFRSLPTIKTVFRIDWVVVEFPSETMKKRWFRFSHVHKSFLFFVGLFSSDYWRCDVNEIVWSSGLHQCRDRFNTVKYYSNALSTKVYGFFFNLKKLESKDVFTL